MAAKKTKTTDPHEMPGANLSKTQVKELLTTIMASVELASSKLGKRERLTLAVAFEENANEVHEESGGHYAPGSFYGVTIHALRALAIATRR